jgi:predicted DCC family thiol-disulfide oxidoreductase YuxK
VIVLYDDDCGFCRWTVAWGLRRDARGVLEVMPIQSRVGEELLADLTPEKRLRSAHVIHADRGRESGGAAVRAVLAVLPSAGPLAWLAKLWPRATDLAYDFVAGHRCWFGHLVSPAAKRRADALLLEKRTTGLDPATLGSAGPPSTR